MYAFLIICNQRFTFSVIQIIRRAFLFFPKDIFRRLIRAFQVPRLSLSSLCWCSCSLLVYWYIIILLVYFIKLFIQVFILVYHEELICFLLTTQFKNIAIMYIKYENFESIKCQLLRALQSSISQNGINVVKENLLGRCMLSQECK